jgi:hypothetical protein
LRVALGQMGYADDVAELMIAEARKRVSSDDPTLLLIAVVEVARRFEREEPEKPAKRQAGRRRDHAAAALPDDPGDLRLARGPGDEAGDVAARMEEAGAVGAIDAVELVA